MQSEGMAQGIGGNEGCDEVYYFGFGWEERFVPSVLYGTKIWAGERLREERLTEFELKCLKGRHDECLESV